ncbi:alkyl hydroperoxide reductase/ Thiol specific antioxidant/ Mal allergen (plasmid) [Emticicia oligotrophica DSM 17448]|uniref:Alkyl hydroperoxide reductase/ Thiol specific antioxidant/ Mal allergen n=1 Tax=Emticicia oligotrophica (strain DSM 17448 / CIP 109782 / MTCC 6937 / GPTSA100-15) TaxID=929562 RepID=A0ABM5N840_EMTOG|nr:TlpA disulfide reductase family protein [Emticicia oligotrophica]AFK05634.1 alkyl hydroperoxide reductase/ Thiol specific antioxidant/ Mal allergen [Emticicia oligotrophica DSM 17448]
MKNILKYLLLIFFPLSIQAQKPFLVRIQFPKNINVENIRIGYENGNERISFPTKFIDNKITVSGTYYSKYLTLWIYDDLKDSYVNWTYFWIDGSKASISFTTTDTSQNILKKFILKNAFSLDIVGKKHNSFVRTELEQYKNFYEKYFSPNYKGKYTDSLNKVFNGIFLNLCLKDISFIKANGNQYYAFDYFRRNLAPLREINPDTLLSIFNTSFPKSYKESFEGKETEIFLKGKVLKKNAIAPIIKAADYYSKEELSLINKKYTLLVFWASWCKPCIAEIPKIKELHKFYQTDNLKIIYVTLDEDSTKFLQAVKKYDLSWNHVYGDKKFIKSFGVLGIPQIFLIDSLGKIAYSREEEKDFKSELPILEAILEEKL